ncbi:MAG: helix-turn-helix domain-containing protein [Flavobacteriaceae bacterium]
MDIRELILVLSCLGLAQSLFLCIYFLGHKKGNRKANIFLVLILFGLSLRIGKSVLNTYLDLEPWHRNIGLSGILIVGPSLLFYLRQIRIRKVSPTPSQLFHFLPFLIFIGFSWAIPNNFDFISKIIYVGIFVHLLGYVGWAWLEFKSIKDAKPSAIKAWSRNLIIAVGIIGIFYLANFIGIIPWYIGGAILYSILLYVFSYLLLKRQDVLEEKYQGSALDKNASLELFRNVKALFDKEKMYLEANISLAGVAKKLLVSPRELSQAINENGNANFSEFVTAYRIEASKSLLAHPNYIQEKIATIAYDSGFGNVTSFNLAFKAATGLTPSQYRNKIRLA